MPRRVLSSVPALLGAAFAVFSASNAGAQAVGPRPASAVPSQAAPPPACFPACREGFVCHTGRCVSLCNPPCPEGQACVEGRRCEVAAPGAVAGPVYEPPPPRTRTFGERSHGLIGFHLGFSGDVETDSATENDLASTYGVNVRSDIPVIPYLVIGPFLQLGAWRPDASPAPDRSYYVDIDLTLRARAPITTDSVNFQLWAGVPIGLTFHFLGEDVEDVASMGFGWNVGVLFGGAVHFTPKFGLFTELGWMQHKVSHAGDTVQDLDYRLSQWSTNLGFVFRN